MAEIDVKSIGNLLIVSVTGKLTADEVISIVDEYYSNGIVKDVIWDLTHGTLHTMSHEGFRSIARATKKSVASGARKGGKTAYVGDSEIKCGLLNMYTAIAKITGVPIKYDVFNSIEEVRDWIDKYE
jgi:hypothetical protein